MRIGIPKEIKTLEGRVSLVASNLLQHINQVLRLPGPGGLEDPALKSGINFRNGEIVHSGIQVAMTTGQFVNESTVAIRTRYPESDD
jgi:alanine dehydrogenase